MESENKTKPKIMHVDDHLVIIDKPTGLLVHYNKYARKEANVINYLGGYLQQKIYTIHRLDRGTSGIMVFGRSSEVAGQIARQFMNRSVTKRYLALVKGKIQETITIEQPIRNKFNKELQSATTIVKPVSTIEQNKSADICYTLVSLDLITGRPHQARIHCQELDHPIIGDNTYGDKLINQQFSQQFALDEMFLRSYCLEILHPADNQTMTVWAGIPESWLLLLRNLAIDLTDNHMKLMIESKIEFG